MNATIRAGRGWLDVGDIDGAGISYSEGRGTISGDSYRQLYPMLPMRGFGNARFEIELGDQVLHDCRILSTRRDGTGREMSFVYTV